MRSDKIQLLIRAFKQNNDIRALFGDNVVYSSFPRDIDELGLLIQPTPPKKKDCYSKALVQIQIIDKKDSSTRMQMKQYMEVVEDFLIGKLKNFAGFEVVAVHPTTSESILQNNKNRFVYSKRFRFYF